MCQKIKNTMYIVEIFCELVEKLVFAENVDCSLVLPIVYHGFKHSQSKLKLLAAIG